MTIQIAPISELVLLLDIDGVLAPIVADPDQAVVSDDMLAVIAELSQRCALVGVVTGRDLARARELVPLAGIWTAALHGMHIQRPDGSEDLCPVAQAARADVEVAATLAQTVGWHYEDKGNAVTVHFRQRGTLGQQIDAEHVRAQLSMVLNPTKVQIHDAKQLLEVRPIGARTKRDAVRMLAAHAPTNASTILYVGDDLTDLDAFDALDEISQENSSSEQVFRCIKVAVGGPEAPPDLVKSADMVLPGEAGVLPFLTGIAHGDVARSVQ